MPRMNDFYRSTDSTTTEIFFMRFTDFTIRTFLAVESVESIDFFTMCVVLE